MNVCDCDVSLLGSFEGFSSVGVPGMRTEKPPACEVNVFQAVVFCALAGRHAISIPIIKNSARRIILSFQIATGLMTATYYLHGRHSAACPIVHRVAGYPGFHFSLPDEFTGLEAPVRAERSGAT